MLALFPCIYQQSVTILWHINYVTIMVAELRLAGAGRKAPFFFFTMSLFLSKQTHEKSEEKLWQSGVLCLRSEKASSGYCLSCCMSSLQEYGYFLTICFLMNESSVILFTSPSIILICIGCFTWEIYVISVSSFPVFYINNVP